MKKLYISAALMMMGVGVSNAQTDTLLYENFQGPTYDHIVIAFPDPSLPEFWYDYDEDQISDANGRDQWWFLAYAVAQVDSLTPDGDTNFVMGSSSWHSSVAQASNWLITPAINIVNNTAVLKFKTATRQTPYYLDGYEVKISTGTNDPLDFTDLVYTAAEYSSGAVSNGGNFAAYTFTPSGAWIQGWNGSALVPTEIEYDGDSARFLGILTEKTISLASYSGQTIFVAFHHNSLDDNLLTIDDILVTGTLGTEEFNLNLNLNVNVFPNPTSDYLNLGFEVQNATPVIYTITDVMGRMVSTQSMGLLNSGKHAERINVSGLATGTYNLSVKTDKGENTISFIVK